MKTLIGNARLIDGTGAPPRDRCALLIENGRLVHVGPLARDSEPAGGDASTVDVGGRTVMPGMVEGHIHLSYNGFAWNPHGEYAEDIEVFVEVIGFSPLEAITCATRNGAELMRMADRIGTLEVGKYADLLVLEDDPLADIRVLQDRERMSVMKAGEFVTRRFGAASV